MRFPRTILPTLWILLLCAGTASADKAQELHNFKLKPWSLRNLPSLTPVRGDMAEAEPNDTCPGNLYTLNETYHGEISTDGDEDWIGFLSTVGEEITVGTDADGTLPTVDTVIELYEADCTTLLASDDDSGPGLYSMIDRFTAPYTGLYFLRIRGFSTSASGGNYIAVGSSRTATGPGFCPVAGYSSASADVSAGIPDNDPGAPLVTPAITFPPKPGFQITDVVVDLEIEHTWVGDLVVTLKHTSSGGEVKTVQLLDRPGAPPNTFGCAGDLVNGTHYYFGTGAGLTGLGDTDCPTTIPGACYSVASESAQGLDVFRGQPVDDGSWVLEISDNAVGDIGILHRWTVHLMSNAPVSVEDRSWGAIKSRYRR